MQKLRFYEALRPKPVIAMVHFPALPGSPEYDERCGVDGILRWVERDLEILQDNGVDAVMFGNEADRPYLLKAEWSTVSTMAYAVGRLSSKIKVPFGVDVLWDPEATVALGACVGASFVREVFTGLYASDMGFWSPSAGSVQRLRRHLDARGMLLLYNINAEFAALVDSRPLDMIARSVEFSSRPDAICVSGGLTGTPADLDVLGTVRKAVKSTPVIMNTGVSPTNIAQVLEIADGVIVGTALKSEGNTWNPVEPARVAAFMRLAREARGE